MNTKGRINENTIFKNAEEIGLKIDKLKLDMNDPEIQLTLKKNRDVAKSLELNGTPAFIIGDIISIGFEEGECDWCECMNNSANMFGDAGGWGMAVAAIACPECVVVMAAGFAVGCGISALSN